MDKLQKALDVFGDSYIDEIDKILRGKDKVATGKLLKSLDTRVIKTGFGTSYTLKLVAEEYLKYVDEGRRAGAKAPPIQPIKDWARAKGLDEGLAFPIAKSIGEKGIKPTNVIEEAFNYVIRGAEGSKLEKGASDWVDDLILDRMKGLSKNKNITFK